MTSTLVLLAEVAHEESVRPNPWLYGGITLAILLLLLLATYAFRSVGTRRR